MRALDRIRVASLRGIDVNTQISPPRHNSGTMPLRPNPISPLYEEGLSQHPGRGLFPKTSMVTIEVEIDHGKVTPSNPTFCRNADVDCSSC
jgi:hypothetical protein